jgi:hypothetical protein
MQMPTFSSTKTLAAFVCSLAIVACGPPDQLSVKAGPIKGPFVVSDFFTPSGLMGDGQKPGRVSEGINENCKMPRPAGAQGDCYHFLWHAEQDQPVPLDAHWMGAYWVYPANSWGSVPGRSLSPPLDLGSDLMGGELYGYKRVRFYAAIDPVAKSPNLNTFAGGILGNTAKPPQPYSDHGCQIYAADPTDPTSVRKIFCTNADGTPKVFSAGDDGTIHLTSDWQQFSFTIDNWGLQSVIGAFGFSINDSDNPGQLLSIYVDDIVWDDR